MIEPFASGLVVTKPTGKCMHVLPHKQCTYNTNGICCGFHKKFEYKYMTWMESLLNALVEGIWLEDDMYEIDGSRSCGESYTDSYGYENGENGEYGESNNDSRCSDICRCYTINSVKIVKELDTKTGVDIVRQIVGSISPIAGPRLVEVTQNVDAKQLAVASYYLSRLASIMVREAIQSHNYESILEPSWGGGYYGDEFYGFTTHIPSLIRGCVQSKFTLSDLLDAEYHVHKDVTLVDVLDVAIADINIPNKLHFDTCLQEDLYQDYNGIVAICASFGNKYILKDGYHRLASAKKRGDATVKIILAQYAF